MDKPLASCKGQWGRCLVKRPSRHAFVREANEKVFCAMFGCGGRCRAYTRFGFTMLQRLRHDGDRRDMFGSCLRSLHHHSLVPAAAPRFSNTLPLFYATIVMEHVQPRSSSCLDGRSSDAHCWQCMHADQHVYSPRLDIRTCQALQKQSGIFYSATYSDTSPHGPSSAPLKDVSCSGDRLQRSL
jgi:hypothetical protein